MSEKRPNLLILHSHDLGQYLRCYGRRTVRTPNLDGLAAKGVRFSNSFCTQPGCSPSRAAIFTGRYPHSNGVMGLSHVQFAWDLNPGERHLAEILRDEGYSATCVGVMHEASSIERCGYEERFFGGAHIEDDGSWMGSGCAPHLSTGNVAFCDGHVEARPLEDVFWDVAAQWHSTVWYWPW